MRTSVLAEPIAHFAGAVGKEERGIASTDSSSGPNGLERFFSSPVD